MYEIRCVSDYDFSFQESKKRSVCRSVFRSIYEIVDYENGKYTIKLKSETESFEE